jgi:DNA-binding NarL/FixJ family response regulator
MNPEIDETLLKGADAFIPKPVKMDLLDDLIRRLCNRESQSS